MNTGILTITVALTAGLLIESTLAQALPAGYWSLEQATEILDKTSRGRTSHTRPCS